MDIQEFQHVLELGLGRAILYLRDHDAGPYRDIILNACLHNQAYDSQIEGNRVRYMFEIVRLTREPGFYREQILTALAARSKDWDSQAYDLVSLFAQQGDNQARRLMQDTFVKNIMEDCPYGGAFMELDGSDGYVFVAAQLGDQALAEDEWVYSFLHRRAEELLGKEEAWLALEQASIHNSRVNAYIEALRTSRTQEEERRKKSRPDVTLFSYEQLKEQLYRRLPWVHWGIHATEADLKKAAADLLAEIDPERIRRLLSIFRGRRFPLDFRPLIEMANSSDHQISFRAFTALGQIAHPEVRGFALSLLQLSIPRGCPVRLLINNYQDGDHALVETFVQKLQDKDEIHRVDIDIRDFYEAHPNLEREVRIRRQLYEIGPCILCREGHVERLLELNALPDWMGEECQYDANLDIQAKVKNRL